MERQGLGTMDEAGAAGGASYTGTPPGGGSGLRVAAAVVSNRARVPGQETPPGKKHTHAQPGGRQRAARGGRLRILQKY